MKNSLVAALGAALALAAAPGAIAQQTAVAGETGAALLAIKTLPPQRAIRLTVKSPAFKDGGDIPFENTSYRGSHFPGLSWSKGPYGTRTFAVIMQDDDAQFRGQIILHWSMYDIVGRTLAPDMTQPPAGASNGPNVTGPAKPYMGPHTPPGPKHHYHFQVFALDETIAPTPIKTYADLTAAMNGHVLASGELVGLGQADPTAPPRVPPPPAPQSSTAPKQ